MKTRAPLSCARDPASIPQLVRSRATSAGTRLEHKSGRPRRPWSSRKAMHSTVCRKTAAEGCQSASLLLALVQGLYMPFSSEVIDEPCFYCHAWESPLGGVPRDTIWILNSEDLKNWRRDLRIPKYNRMTFVTSALPH